MEDVSPASGARGEGDLLKKKVSGEGEEEISAGKNEY